MIVNYETTWYPSHGEIWRSLHDAKAAGEIRRMVVMDGHQGPKEIGVQPEFFEWLTDPVRNGAGALFDFGCYGANLMTWMMDNARPIAVTAMTKQIKPAIYSKVDDDATILVGLPEDAGCDRSFLELAVTAARTLRCTANQDMRSRPAATILRIRLGQGTRTDPQA